MVYPDGVAGGPNKGTQITEERRRKRKEQVLPGTLSTGLRARRKTEMERSRIQVVGIEEEQDSIL